ncbi:hypothetical protein [Motilibacter aurantiacus]|uniref:hypothetical protein n=1 Tax=Motilibacter aurantiacus TaxID=2714955 RepID=UPI00140CC7F2|nr:hypothetical protein [Motilibacter aurantiacus]NHC44043.1 hypothetical protein [Motilibacter aurantiacus]
MTGRAGRPALPLPPDPGGVPALSTAPAGLVLGRSDAGEAVALRLFGRSSTRVVVGSLELARVLAFRALGLGATVSVGTTRPTAWRSVSRVAGESARRVSVVQGPVRPGTGASMHFPLLVVRDGVAEARRTGREAPAAEGPVTGPWRALLTVLRDLDPSLQRSLAAADVALVGALAPEQATAVCRALEVDPWTAPTLVGLPAQALVLLPRGGAPVAVTLAPTSLEHRLAEPAG